MVLKVIDATECRTGTVIIIDGQPCTVKSVDVSKTGKHGASKCRIEASEIFTGKKKITAVPGSTRFDVPLVEKKRGQVLSVAEDRSTASIMDLDSFETLDVKIMEEVKNDVEVEKQVEYWDIEGPKAIMRVF
jgi:translation initiation factor 5A